MCGHATLATAFVLARELGQVPPFTFQTLSGPLLVEADGARFIARAFEAGLACPAGCSRPAQSQIDDAR
jgi:predicted PhzF superfamily epimerase YddE/YHI9